MKGARKLAIWLGFAGVGSAATVLLGALGQVVAGRLGMLETGGVWAGCLASLAGSLAGAVPLAREIAGRELAEKADGSPIAAIGKASLFRLLVALIAGLAAATSGRWDRKTLLFALVASYVALLAVETWWLLGRLRATQR